MSTKHRIWLKASLALWRARYKLHPSAEAKAKIHQRLKELGLEKPKPKPSPPQPHNVTMYDAVEVTQIPKTAEAVAGYTAGNWPTYNELLKQFPKAHHVSIAIAAKYDAQCLDIEAGDATPADAPSWVRRQHARNVKRPILYASLSVMPDVKQALFKDHIKRSEFRLWVAHYTYKPHIEPGYDATQWTDKALGRNLDCSLCSPSFFS